MAKFYMKKGDNGEVISIEDFFCRKEGNTFVSGLKYASCVGLLNKGKRKDIYFEKYADADRVRVWQGSDVTREATNITFTFWFIGPHRNEIYQEFYEYVKNDKIRYWDDVRKKEALFVLVEAVEPSEDKYIGSTPYIKSGFKFQNLWGECKDTNGLQ